MEGQGHQNRKRQKGRQNPFPWAGQYHYHPQNQNRQREWRPTDGPGKPGGLYEFHAEKRGRLLWNGDWPQADSPPDPQRTVTKCLPAGGAPSGGQDGRPKHDQTKETEPNDRGGDHSDPVA